MEKAVHHRKSVDMIWDQRQLTKAKTLSLTQCWVFDTKLSIMLCKMLACIYCLWSVSLFRPIFWETLKWSHQCHGLTCRQLGTNISYQILHRISGLMLSFELLKTAFLGNTSGGKEKILREKLSPFLFFLTEQGRNSAIRFWEPLFPVHCATFWTWAWIKFHSWLHFPAHLGTIWGQDNGIHHSFMSNPMNVLWSPPLKRALVQA